MPKALTGLVIAHNEGHQIEACLRTLAGADALLVIDHGSQDDTASRARAAGAQAVEGRGTLSELRALGGQLVETPWVLMIDADERLPPDGVAVIRAALLHCPPDVAAFRVHLQTWLGDRPLRFGGYCPERMRLFRRGAVTWPYARVHERPHVTGRVASLPLRLQHLSYRDLAHAREKMRRYAAWAALDLRDRGRMPGLLPALIRTGWRWLRVGLLRGGLLMGRAGWHLTRLQALGVWWRLRWARRGIPEGVLPPR